MRSTPICHRTLSPARSIAEVPTPEGPRTVNTVYEPALCIGSRCSLWVQADASRRGGSCAENQTIYATWKDPAGAP